MKADEFKKSLLRKILVLFLLLICLLAHQINAQQKNIYVESIIESKTFPFITCLKNTPAVLKIIGEDPELKKLTSQHKERIELSVKECKDAGCYADAIQWAPEEVTDTVNELNRIAEQNEAFRGIISTLKASGYYNLYASYPDADFIKAVWNNVAGGITHILDVYVKGSKPFYAAIDSASFPAYDEGFREDIKGMLINETKYMGEKAFFEVPVKIAVNALILNQRDEAARYEPLNGGINKTAFDNIRNIKWENYQYSLILVPGKGPENEGIAIDPQGIVRCNLAAQYYQAGHAPFIVVSGGHVSPNKTPYCEAAEMKKYMVKELNIPENVIFIEPHARHTTTNMRNTARMVYRFNIPADKKILIVTDPGQNAFIDKMEQRFMMELGCVPYHLLKKLSDNTSEYYPDRNALQCNPKDPLDP